MRTLPLLLASSLLLAACAKSTEPTGAVVLIAAQPAVAAQTTSLEIRVYGSDGLTTTGDMVLRDQRTVALGEGAFSLPYSIGITPLGGEITRLYRIEADARDANGKVLTTARAISGYTRSKVLRLDLVFEDLCLGVPPCSDLGQTCRGAVCVDAHVDQATLPAYGSDAGSTWPLDGGSDAAMEAGMDAAMEAGMDAAVDAGMDAAVDAGVDCGAISLVGGATSPNYSSGTTQGSTATWTCPGSSEKLHHGTATCFPSGSWSNAAACAAITVTTDSVTFERTGLQWTRTNGASGLNQGQGSTHCANLVLDGQSDWRLPTVAEFLGTVDYGRVAPAFDPALFPDRQSAVTYWTNTSGPPASGTSWWVDQAGNASYDSYNLFKEVRCVRTVTTRVPQLTNNGNGTVTDAVTGLVWQAGVSPSAVDQAGASTYCSTLDLGGVPVGTWRAPTISELETLVLFNASPAINTTYFSGTPSTCCQVAYLWSSTAYAAGGGGWAVDFYEGVVQSVGNTTTALVRCVR